MRAPISVIIPTLNAEHVLPECLESLMEGLQAGLIRELVISDGGSDDSTCKLAEEAGAQLIKGTPSRGAQLRRGCTVAKGEWLLILHADTVLETGWSGAAHGHLHLTQAGYFKHRFRMRGVMPVWVSAWANFRSRAFGLPYGDQGLLVRRDVYEAVGGYPDQPLMEDVALVRALKGRLQVLPAHALTSAERYQAQGWLRRGARNLWTLFRYSCGVDPERLFDAYRR